MPTVGVLGQTRRWITPPAVVLTLGFSLFQNYFSVVGPSIVVQSDVLSVTTVPVVVGSQSSPYAPINIGRVIATFGVNVSDFSVINGLFSGTQSFVRTTPPQPTRFGTADGWGDLGQQAMGVELLVAPGSGSLNNKVYHVVAGGDMIISPGTRAAWSIICRLTGNGQGNGLLRADTLVNGQSSQVLYSNRNPLAEPKLQLSIGATLQGSAPGNPQIRLIQFELQQQ